MEIGRDNCASFAVSIPTPRMGVNRNRPKLTLLFAAPTLYFGKNQARLRNESMSEQNPYSSYPIRTEPEQRFAVDPPSRLTLFRLFLQESLQVIVPALVLALTVHLFLAQATIVYGQSMEPNLSERQRLIIDKVGYRLYPPQRNDIVVIDIPDMQEMLVKRIIGLPGETVALQRGVVYVNGEPLPEPFPHDLGYQSTAPITLGPLSYFVMGDNRDNSNDSRTFGPVKREHIVGRVWLRYWPLSEFTSF